MSQWQNIICSRNLSFTYNFFRIVFYLRKGDTWDPMQGIRQSLWKKLVGMFRKVSPFSAQDQEARISHVYGKKKCKTIIMP